MNQIFFPHRRLRWSDEYIHGWTFCIPILSPQVGLVRHMVGVITCYLTMKLIFIEFYQVFEVPSRDVLWEGGREGGREGDTSVEKSNVDCTVQWCKVGRVTLSCTVQPGCQDCARPPPTNLPSTTIYYYVVCTTTTTTMWLVPIVILLIIACCPITFQSVIISLWKALAWPTVGEAY